MVLVILFNVASKFLYLKSVLIFQVVFINLSIYRGELAGLTSVQSL